VKVLELITADFDKACPPIPDGSSFDGVRDWVEGTPPFRDGGIDGCDFDSIQGELSWLRVFSTNKFWEEDVGILSRSTDSLITACAHLNLTIGFSARSVGDGLEVSLGTRVADLDVLHNALKAALPGIRLMPCDSPSGLEVSAYLKARIQPDPDPEAPSMIERLAALDSSARFSLQSLLIPVAAASIESRRREIGELETTLAGARSFQQQTDILTTRSYENPVVENLVNRIRVEAMAAEEMAENGGYRVMARIGAIDDTSLAGVSGAILAIHRGAGPQWRIGSAMANGGVLPISLIPSTHLGDLLRLPRRDVLGIICCQHVQLDEHPEPIHAPSNMPRVKLGMTMRGAKLDIPESALCNHVLVSGASGSGKTAFVASVIKDLSVPFWVIEPVKNEWSGLEVDGLRVWRPGDTDRGVDYPLNPLECPSGTSLASHLDRLVALLRGSLSLPDPLPAIIQLGLKALYEDSGWDLIANRNVRDVSDWPNLEDLVEACCRLPMMSDYSLEVQGNIRGALAARIGSLTFGPRAATLLSESPFPIEEALKTPMIINLDGIGDDHARSFFMGLLLIRIAEYCRSHPTNGLGHVVVVEEAHRVMGNGQKVGTVDADPISHVAEAFGDLLAEIRASGTGLIVLEQSPSRLVASALVNTATKVIFHVDSTQDQTAVGAALGLTSEEQRIFAGLQRHEALVKWEGMDRPVRGTMGANFLTQHSSIQGTVSGKTQVSILPPDALPIVAALVRSNSTDASHLRARLDEIINSFWPGIPEEVLEEVVASSVRSAVRTLFRDKHWRMEGCAEAAKAVLDGDYENAHPRILLQSLPQPMRGCSSACPSGGCEVRELAATQVRVLELNRNVSTGKLVNDPEERRRRFRGAAKQFTRLPDDSNFVITMERCMTVHLVDDWADAEDVGLLLGQMAREEGSDGN